MNPFHNSSPSFAALLGQSGLSEEEITTLRRRAWTEQGCLIIRPSHPQLHPHEVQLLLAIGERLYGGPSS